MLEGERRIWNDELPFPAEEYAVKLQRVQDDLAQRDLAGALIFDPENIYWLTGYQTIGYFTFQALYIPPDGKPTLITRIVNRNLALALETIGAVEPVYDTQDHVEVLADYLIAQTPADASVGLEQQSWNLKLADYLRLEQLAGVTFTAWDGFIQRQRIVKTEVQLERMRHAARAAEAGIDRALKAIAPGKTDNDVAAALYQGAIEAGSEYFGHPPMVVSGPRSALCFALWRRRQIQKGDVVLLEGAGVIDRYHALMARSAVVGKATDAQKETADALIGILETAQENIKPGLPAGEIDRLCRADIKRKGLDQYFKSRVAYGIGIGFPPNWAEGHIYAIRPDESMLIEPNMTFHVIPTMFREDFGMAISDSVRVTENGCELLTRYPRDLVIVD